MQSGMLFLHLFDPDGYQYFEQQRYKILGNVRIGLVKKVWAHIAQMNEMLRTVFRWKGLSHPVQIILKKHDVPVVYHDLSDRNEAEIEQVCNHLEHEQWTQRVDITTSPFRITLLKIRNDEYDMILSSHHIILDGWSNAILLKEFLKFYSALDSNIEPGFEIKTKYKKYIQWLTQQNTGKSLQFWKNYLADYRFKTCFIESSSNPKPIDIHYFEYKVENESVAQIRDYLKKHKITLAALLYSVWAIFLLKYFNIDEIVFGITVSCRPPAIRNVDQMVGLFINTIPLRVSIKTDSSIFSILTKINNDLISFEPHQYVSLSEITSELDLKKKGVNSQLFDSTVVIQNYPISRELHDMKNESLKIKLHNSLYAPNLPITLGIKAFDENMQLDFSYNANFFDEKFISDICSEYLNMMIKILDQNPITSGDNFTLQDIEFSKMKAEPALSSTIQNNINNLENISEVDFHEIF